MLSSSAYQDVSNSYFIKRMEQCLYSILYFDVIMILITLMKLGMVFKMYLN
jgi:hypothetical protein